jgi:hypothetical protein
MDGAALETIPRRHKAQSNKVLEPSAVYAVQSATRSTSRVGFGSVLGRYAITNAPNGTVIMFATNLPGGPVARRPSPPR